MADIYHTIAADGFHTPLRAIASVGDADRQLLARYAFEVEQRFQARDIYLLQYALRQVMLEGTGAGTRLPGAPSSPARPAPATTSATAGSPGSAATT